jgi:hypothetical protein
MGIGGFFKGILVWVFGSLLTMVLVLAIVANTMKTDLFTPDFYFVQFDKANIYSTLKGAALDAIVENSIKQQLSSLPAELQQQITTEIKAEFSTAVPTTWFKKQVDSILTNVLLYLKDERATVSMVIRLQEVKPNLLTAAKNVATKLVEAQVQQASGGTLGQEAAKELAQQMVTQFGSDLEKQMPDTVDIDQLTNRSASKGLAEAKGIVGYVFLACNLLYVVAAVLAIIIALLVFDVKSVISKLGWCILWAGIPLVFMSFAGPQMMASALGAGMPQPQAGAENALGALMSVIVLGIMTAIFESLKTTSIIVLVAGVVLIVVPYLIKKGEGVKSVKS